MDVNGGQESAIRARTEVGADAMQLWKEAVTLVRLSQVVVDQCGDPEVGSALAGDDAACPAAAKISDAARGALFAALDNLMMWCNVVAPKVYVEGAPSEGSPRPHFTLARAGIECAAQVGWLLESDESAIRVERHLRLVMADMDEERKAASKVGADAGAQVAQRIAAICDEVGAVKRSPTYLELVHATASHGGVTAEQGEVLWRTASAAAHGKLWFVGATHTTTLGEEYAEGRSRAVHEANPDSVTAVVTFASRLVHWATALYAVRLGLDVSRLYAAGLARLASDLPRAVPDPTTGTI